MFKAQNEVDKLQKHLSLLKEEYIKLQKHSAEIERKYNSIAASTGDLSDANFVSRLLLSVSELHGKNTYSDIKIKLKNKILPAHRLVLSARSEKWNASTLQNVQELGMCCMTNIWAWHGRLMRSNRISILKSFAF